MLGEMTRDESHYAAMVTCTYARDQISEDD